MSALIHWFSRNHVAANFLMLIVLAAGFFTWFRIKKEIFPETSVDVIAVRVLYPNAAPEEVERGVTSPIEEAISDVDGVKRMTSISAESLSSVFVEVEAGFETRNVMDDVKTRIDAIQNLAEQAEKPTVEELLLKSQILSIAVSADTDAKTLRRVAERVREELLLYKKPPPASTGAAVWALLTANTVESPITQVQIAGARKYEISIEVSENTLREYGLSFDEVATAIRLSSLDLPSGSVRTDSGEVLIRAASKRYTVQEFSSVPVRSNQTGATVLLGDIATIRDDFEDKKLISHFDGRPAVLVNVFRTGNQDTLRLVAAVQDYIQGADIPPGINLEIWNDTSVYLDGRMRLLLKNGTFGLILVFLVLAMFLRPLLAFLVAIGIPVSFCGAVMLMPKMDISINLISLFAFILVLGIVVDDAIIVGENVFRRMRKGEHPRDASPLGTHEVGIIVIFGVLTTAVAFTPMLGVSGVSGKIWRNIPLIVIPTLLFSLVQSKLVLPAHLALLKPVDADREVGPITRLRQFFTHGLEHFVESVYNPFLHRCLHMRYVVLTVFVAMFCVAAAYAFTGWIRWQFFPNVEAEVISAKLVMPNGGSFENTHQAVEKLENALVQLGEEFRDKNGKSIIIHRLATTGSQPFPSGFDNVAGPPLAEHLGEVTVELSPAESRKYGATEIISRWRELVGDIPGALELVFRMESEAGGNAIDLDITGPNMEELIAASEDIKEALRGFEGVIDISDSDRDGKQELKLNTLPQAELLNIRLGDIARQMRQGFYGEEVQRLQRGRDEVKVMLRYSKNERERLSNLETMKIRTPRGDEIPVSAVASAEWSRGYSTIFRSDQRRAITIRADIDKAVPGANAKQVVTQLNTTVLPALAKKYPGLDFSYQGEQKDQRQSIEEIMRGFIFALLIMYILMAIPLKSYIQPMIVMCVIPFGLVGAVIGHIIMRTDLSIMSLIGIVALAGVVVNDSLVLVDYVNRHRAQGDSLITAVRDAGARRFRAILLTSMTTFAGLTPMLLETDLQAKFLIPMAISLSFGILFATGITLLLVPCVYVMLEDVKSILKKMRGMRDPGMKGAHSGRADS